MFIPFVGGSSISEGTMSNETLDDSDLGVLAVLLASLSLHSLALPLDRDPLRFLLPLRRSFTRDLRLGVLGLGFLGSGSGGKARFKLDTEEDLEGGRWKQQQKSNYML